MRYIRILLEEAKGHLELVKSSKSRIEEKDLNDDLLEDRGFLTPLDAFIFRFIKLQSSVGKNFFSWCLKFLPVKTERR